MRCVTFPAGLLPAMLILCLGAGSVVAQPEVVAPVAPNPPAPAQPAGFDIAGLMTQTNTAVNTLALNLLASKRLEKVANEGLIVSAFSIIPEKADEGMMTFVAPWIQEKATIAMIQHDDALHFEVVDRIKVDQVIKELKLDAAALRDPKNWMPVGKAAGAKYLLTGTVSVMPMAEHPVTLGISVTARVIALDTGRALAGHGVDFVFINGQPLAPPPPPPPPADLAPAPK